MVPNIPIEQIATEIKNTIDLPLPLYHDEKILLQQLAERINHLIQTDFGYLVSLLYRLDVNENKVKSLLHDNPDTNAGMIIAQLVVERQAQKIRTRQQFKQDDRSISDEEKW